jgi:vacuolar-type H+-ATPase subunit H
MKIKTLVPAITLGAVLVWAAGCGKKEEPTPPPKAQETQKPTGAAVGEAQKAAETAKTTAETAVESAKATAAGAAEAAKAKAQEIIDKAKSLVGENKYQDALNALQGLAGMSLTDEQQKIVDGLKKQIQDALAKKAAGEATSAVGNILGGKK